MSPKAPKNHPKQPPRADDFKSLARELGCDEDKATFEAKLKKIAKAKPKGGK